MDIEDRNDAPKDLHDAEEVQNVDAINTLVEEILLLDSEIDVDRKVLAYNSRKSLNSRS